MATKTAAGYEGIPTVQFLSDGRQVKLVDALVFHDNAESEWAVPAGAIVDGASIPRVLWSIVGGPFEGKYRDASIIHDWFCDRRTRTWQATHRVFYEAMIVSKVTVRRAKIMYFGVYWGGPRWEERVVFNNNMVTRTYNIMDFMIGPSTMKIPIPSPSDRSGTKGQKEFLAKLKEVDWKKLDLNQIEHLAENLHPE
jgi:hypothetical protein